MPHPRTHIVSGGVASAQHTSSLQDEDDDDLDDICPVCESECTCPKKSTSSTLPTPSASSIPSSLPFNDHPVSAGKRPLKIKLTLPPKLKLAKPSATHPTGARLGAAAQDAGPSSYTFLQATPGAPASKRRGRPPKAVPARYKKKVVADDMEYRARGTTGTSAGARKVHQPSVSSAADLSDSTLSDYPTFFPAATESTHSSSSQSSDSEIESSDDDESFVARNDQSRQFVKLLPSHLGHQKRERGGGSRWETRPRDKSLGAGEEEEEESSVDSDESSEDSSKDGDDEDDDEDGEADVEEGENTGMILPDEDGMNMDDQAQVTHGRIGVSFPGTGWSDDDDESSFDADLFFANLDSDSGGSSPETHLLTLNAFCSEDVAPSGAFSADEDDALMRDLDPSVQLRRGKGEFEIGVDLDSHPSSWDGEFLFANSLAGEGLGLSFGIQAPDEDDDMGSLSGSEATVLWDGSAGGAVVLHESDGDTTEDELVDSDGLPNPRAMMLFKWPTTISAINPLSTLSPVSQEPPANASPSTRIALASISAHRRSPPPTPSPADILAGRISIDDLEDIEVDKMEQAALTVRKRRGSNVPIMGQFMVEDNFVGRTAVVCVGYEAPSFYPRAVRVQKHLEFEQYDITSPAEASAYAVPPPLTTESSEDTHELSYTSDVSAADAIELDDVLDSSLLDSEPSAHEYEMDLTDLESRTSPMKFGASPHLQNLTRWDRIPMATFRRTRESATASGVDGAASDNGLGALQYHRGIGTMMGGTSFTPPRPLGLDKMSRAAARKKRGRHSHGSSPTLLPARDGVLGSPFIGASNMGGHSNKSKKELKKEKAMMKKKLVAKASQHKYCQPNRTHHHHHPNHKSRATNAVQRTSFPSSAGLAIPSLSI